MTRSRRWYVQLAFGFLAMLASMGLVDRYITPAAAAPPQIDSTQVTSQAPGRVEPKMPEFWIGVRCYPVPSAIRAYVDLPKGQGLLVADVVKESPGKKGGIQQNDILVNLGKTPLKSVRGLINAVEASKGNPFEINLLRAGKPTLLTVQPEKRPKATNRQSLPPVPNSPDMAKIQHVFEQFQPGQGGQPPMRLRFFHQGMVLSPDASTHPRLPANLTISITRTGSHPAEIVVKKLDEKTQKPQTYKLNEKQVDQLPNDLRIHVERMLNGVVVGSMPQFDFIPSLDPNQTAPLPPVTRETMEQQWQAQMQLMQNQMGRMNRMMNQMMKQMKQRTETPEPTVTP